MHRNLLASAALLALTLAPGRAWAFPWMIHHGYANCAQCHVDPSGAGILTDYGRAQGEILLRSNYGAEPKDPEKTGAFLFGAVNLPDVLKLQFDGRSLIVPDPANFRYILMQADARGAIQAGIFSASGAVGVVSEGAKLAQVTSNTDSGWNMVAREYWLGLNPVKGVSIKAGRMNLPFGIRTEDHILYVRDVTDTNTNDDQQVGASVVYTSKKVRAEVMGIAGNFQVSPDAFRKRGYSGYVSFLPSKTFEIGASSMWTTTQADFDTLAPANFMAHGLFTRAAPVQPLAIMAEADVTIANNNGDRALGLVGTAILDYEPVQGVHVQGIGQYCDSDFGNPAAAAWNGGLGAQWFFFSHMDVRLDGAYGTLFCTQGAEKSPYGLVQAHIYL